MGPVYFRVRQYARVLLHAWRALGSRERLACGSRRAVLWGVFIWISRAAIAGAFMLRARRVAAIVLGKKTTGENSREGVLTQPDSANSTQLLSCDHKRWRVDLLLCYDRPLSLAPRCSCCRRLSLAPRLLPQTVP